MMSVIKNTIVMLFLWITSVGAQDAAMVNSKIVSLFGESIMLHVAATVCSLSSRTVIGIVSIQPKAHLGIKVIAWLLVFQE